MATPARNEYLSGTTVNITVTFTDPTFGTPSDPTTVNLLVKSPRGFETPASGPTKASVGVYSWTVDARQPGIWTYRVIGAGQANTAAEGQFIVKRSLLS